MRKMNKKGDIATTLLVVMALILTIVALFTFVKNFSGIRDQITGGKFLETVYAEEDGIKFSLKDVGARALEKAYNDAAVGGDYASGKNAQGFILSSYRNIDSQLQTELQTGFLNGIKGYSYENDMKSAEITFSDNLVKMSMTIKLMKTFKLSNQGREWILYVIPTPFTKEDISQLIAVTYSPKIEVQFNFSEIGLNSFKEVYDASSCQDKNCWDSKLGNFVSTVTDEGDYRHIILESKKKFFIDGNLQNIKLDFLVKK